MSGAMLPKAASRLTRRGTAVKLEHRHGGDEGLTFSDGDVKTGEGQSRTSEAQAEGRTGPKAGGGPRRRVA